MTVDTRDILLKAAEDVQSGMWCKGDWFRYAEVVEGWPLGNHVAAYERHMAVLDTGAMAERNRCAEGSLIFATALLGGNGKDYERAVHAVESNITVPLYSYNDSHLPDGDPFEAGQQLATLFRKTAESL